MSKSRILIFLLVSLSMAARAQQTNIDSLAREANMADNDTSKLVRMRTVARIYAELNPDSCYVYSEQALRLARKLHLKLDEASALREICYSFLNRGNYPRALQNGLAAIAILEDPSSEKRVLVGKFPGDDELSYRKGSPHAQRLSELAFTHQILGILYANSNYYEKSWHHHLVAREYAVNSGNIPLRSIVNLTFNRVYLHLKKNDSALLSIQNAHEGIVESGYKRYLGSVLLNMGRTYAALGNPTLANDYYKRSLVVSKEQGYFRGVVASGLLLAESYSQAKKYDSAFQYIVNALSGARNLEAPDLLLRSYTALTKHYRNAGNNDSVAKYQALIIRINDSLFNAKNAQQFQNIDFEEQARKQQIEEAQKTLRNRWRMYGLVAGLSIFLIIVIILWRNAQNRKKANQLLSRQKAELESTLSTLRTTQRQLVQSEKMASLGELTAGIAHEIQNPLNFVNNFSEVNREFLAELKEELNKGNIKEASAITDNVIANEEKILHHGQRADSIVKGMLQHSRTSSGQKEPTDINALCDEYLRLAYHGLRARDKTFTATTKTDFDNSIGKISIVPQDIGRVILNLINNAFYAVNEKQKRNANGYEPLVIVSTKTLKTVDGQAGPGVEISIKDNGSGISQKIVDKIFQPFFTTKPSGHGTGLGLSLGYDIIKAHGGDLAVETKEGEGSNFTIKLPILTS